jgi:hypothetical protein
METTITFEIGQMVMCREESQSGDEVLGVVEYFKDGWVGVRGIDRTGFRTSTLIPQRPENLMPIEL